MANLAQLQCFNKILLQKMERMEFEHKKQLDILQSKYATLIDLTYSRSQVDDLHLCQNCDYHFDPEQYEEPNCLIDHDEDIYYCSKCATQEDCPLTKCNDCDEVINKSLTCNGYNYCKYCFKRRQYDIYYDVYLIDEFAEGNEFKSDCLELIKKYKK